MKIFCGNYTEESINGLLLEKKGKKYRFIREENLVLEDLDKIKFKVKVSLNVPEYIIQKVYIPPVKDKSSKEILIKNKLSNLIEEDISNYKIIYFEQGIENSTLAINVILIKTSFLLENNPELLEKFDILSTDAFGILGFSKEIYEDKYIFHFFTTNRYTLSVLSKGEYIEYIRYSPVPEYVFSEEDIENFYYESFNLTYLYLRQNRSIDVDFVLLSGDIVGKDSIIKQVYDFSQKPVISLNYGYFIDNIPVKTALKNTSSLGLLFIGSKFDIRDKDILFSRRFKFISKYLSIFFFFLNVVMAFVLAFKFMSYKEATAEIEYKEKILKSKIDVLEKSIKYSKGELNYFINYVKLYKKHYSYTIFDIMNDLKKLLKFHPYKDITYIDSKKNYSISISSKVSFNSLLELDKFNRKLLNILNKYKNKFKVLNKTTIDVNKFTIYIDITILKEKK